MGPAQGEAVLADRSTQGALVNPKLGGEIGGGVPVGVELNGVVDLLLGGAAAAHWDIVAMQGRADGAAFDAELFTQVVDGRARGVALDQLLDLLVIELPSEPVHGANLV